MHFFIIPATACNSSCTYCFGPSSPGSLMDLAVLEVALNLFTTLTDRNKSETPHVTFHGGEPMLAGADFYANALPMVQKAFGGRASIGIQSNLWQIDESFIELFKQYRVNVGTSLDGPEDINDRQRGKGYFKRTLHAMEKLKCHGIYSGCVATFTNNSSKHFSEIFEFFLASGVHFEVHPAVKPLHYCGDESQFLDPFSYGKLMVDMLELYLPHSDRIKIGTLDTMIRSVSFNKSGLCTFTRCLGKYLAVDPSGELYTCNRFAGNKEFSVGHLSKVRSWDDIVRSQGWQKLIRWEEAIEKECSNCLFESICHGGCPYNAFATVGRDSVRDPYCQAYKTLYRQILDRGSREFFSDSNLHEMKKDDSSILHNGPMLKIMNNNPHPFDIRNAAEEIVAAGITGIADHRIKAEKMLARLGIPGEKAAIPSDKLYNLYLHITGSCNLRCSHCYAYTSGESSIEYLPVEKILKCIAEASNLGFGKVIITGGEPLTYPDFDRLTAGIGELRKQRKLSRIVLRTNLSSGMSVEQVEDISASYDQISVSLDGSEGFHDTRRGKGNYAKVLGNIKLFPREVLQSKVVLSTVFDYQAHSKPSIENEKRHLYELKERFHLSDIRFLPLLPLGRVGNRKTRRPESDYLGISRWAQKGFHPRRGCGIGNNLMIDPDGSAYPCHVLKRQEMQLGNINYQNLEEMLRSDHFNEVKNIGVDTNTKCRNCNYRYLCGGVCQVWLDDDCTDLFNRARELIREALKVLNLPSEEELLKVLSDI